MEKKPSPIKQLGKLIVMTSTTLLDTFFSDDADKKNQSEKVKEIQRTLQEAAACSRCISDAMLISSGPVPSIGDSTP